MTNLALNNKNNVVQFPRRMSRKGISTLTEPIRNTYDIERAREYFKNKQYRYKNLELRDYALFVTGTNIARRITDILDLKISDVLHEDKTFKSRIRIIEQKTKKPAIIPINGMVRRAVGEYLEVRQNWSMDDYLFASNKGNKAITRQRAWEIMKEMSKELGLEENIGTHSLRKTWGYQQYKHDREKIGAINKAYNHRSMTDTHKYICIDQEEIDAVFAHEI